MDQYVTGKMIKKLRESRGLTQSLLADILMISDKTISKWETGKGYPDISLLEGLSKALNISITELLLGQNIDNKNVSANMLKTSFYVCPVCGNVIHSTGEAMMSCHGITLPKLEAEDIEYGHNVQIDIIEDEYFVKIDHPMTKKLYVSFICGVSFDSVHLVKLYPEGEASARFKTRGIKYIYYYCNQDGLFRMKINNKLLKMI